MLQIAVVDDENIICEQLSELLKKYQYAHKMMFHISIYHTGENLLADMDDGMIFDLILLDIELAKINGVQVGTYIRNIQKNELCQIIYVSSKTAYALELFKIRPFDFLVKPISETVFFACINKYFELFSKQTYFEYTNKKIRKLIPVSSIIYFESEGRKILIHCLNDEKYEYYGKLADITKNECLKQFIMIHKSYFINIFQISSYEYEAVVLTDGTRLGISKPNRSTVRRIILEYNSNKFKSE